MGRGIISFAILSIAIAFVLLDEANADYMRNSPKACDGTCGFFPTSCHTCCTDKRNDYIPKFGPAEHAKDGKCLATVGGGGVHSIQHCWCIYQGKTLDSAAKPVPE